MLLLCNKVLQFPKKITVFQFTTELQRNILFRYCIMNMYKNEVNMLENISSNFIIFFILNCALFSSFLEITSFTLYVKGSLFFAVDVVFHVHHHFAFTFLNLIISLKCK